MWQALDNAAGLVAPGGKLFIAIYNDQGKISNRWRAIKRAYNRLPHGLRFLVTIPALVHLYWRRTLKDFLRGRPFETWRNEGRSAVCRAWRDLIDWVGGYPFEVAKPEAILDFYLRRGFTLTRLTTCGGSLGCNEYVFVRTSPTAALVNNNACNEQPFAAQARAIVGLVLAMKALITGSGGLIGSECVRQLSAEGWEVVGIDNDMRRQFFGEQGTTHPVVEELRDNAAALPALAHRYPRPAGGPARYSRAERPQFIIHTAAQPSHDKAAAIPYDDFDVNALGTMNLLVAARDFCRESPFCFTSTNKVYGDRPNYLPLMELDKRYDYAGGLDGVDENMSIDQCLHSVFGASKVAADVMCQEFGRYFQMPVGVFRGGCLTGPQHAAVELHGYLAYIVHCAATGKEYTIIRIQREAGARPDPQLRCSPSIYGILPFPALRRSL